MKRRFRIWWRASALFMVLVLSALGPSSVSAVGAGTMEWTGTRWEDPACDTANETFDLRLYRDTNYGGTQWRVCGGKINFCNSPQGSESSAALLCNTTGFDGDTMNDYPSSFKLISIAGGSSCRVVMYEHAGYSGGGLTEWDPVNRTSMFPYNDAVSSAKRVC